MARRRMHWLMALSVIAVVFLAAQVVPYGHQRVNPPVISEPSWDSPATRALAQHACFDCHSNETQWPAYTAVAPVSWVIQHDVEEGRAVLNFSEWNRQQKEASEAAKVVREGEMPIAMYQLMHAQARLTDADREALARGLASSVGSPVAESQ